MHEAFTLCVYLESTLQVTLVHVLSLTMNVFDKRNIRLKLRRLQTNVIRLCTTVILNANTMYAITLLCNCTRVLHSKYVTTILMHNPHTLSSVVTSIINIMDSS